MGKKSPPPKAPDLSPISDAQMKIAEQSNDLAREYLGLSREQYAFFQENAKEELGLARQQADRLFEFQNKAFESDKAMQEFSKQVGQTQMDSMNLQMDYAKRDRERYEKTFLPMQDQYIAEAQAYDTPERREAEASRAMADTQRQAEAARSNADQRLRSMGLDPSQMRSQSLLQTQDVMGAAQQAAAANQARQQVENQGRAMRADAMNLGMGLPAQAAAGFGGAGAAGQGAIGAAGAGQQGALNAIQGGAGVGSTALGFRSQALGNLANLTGSPTQWAGMGGNMLGQASGGYGQAANTMSSNFNNQMSSWNAGQQQAQQNFSNIMGVAGMAAMMAEGGEVRHYAGGGGVGPILREKFGMGGGGKHDVDDVAMSPSIGDPELRRPMTRDERLQRGSAMMAMVPENSFAQPGGFDYRDQAARMLQMGEAKKLMQESPLFRADGGGVPQRARGALPVRQARDMIPAYLAEGEYVLPEDVVRAMGIEKIDKMVQKYHRNGA